jgi:heat shock protein HtpX
VILISENLLEVLTDDELDVTLAHEIGHLVLHHVRLIVTLTIGAATVMLGVVGWILFGVLSYERETLPVSALPTVMFLVSAGLGLVMWVFRTVKRRQELAADRFAVERTGLVEAFESAHRKLIAAMGGDPEEAPHPLVLFLFFDHPTLAQRVAHVRSSGRAA